MLVIASSSFSNSFLKFSGNEILLRASPEVQVSGPAHSKHMLYLE